MEIVKKAKTILSDVKTGWKVPKPGYYMNYKEVAAYAVGGIGAYFVFTMAQQLLLSTTNVIIGNTIGIQPTHMYWMYLISCVLNIPLTALRANIIDNVRHKDGKYRPYILRMGIPTIIISMMFVYTPYDKLSYIWQIVLIMVYNFGLQFFYNFFYDAYENLIHVLSPNTQERANVASIKSVVYSLAPSITNAVIPFIAKAVADDNMYDLRVYRWLYPFIAVLGVVLSIFVVANTEEKIVQAKSHIVQVRFIDALRAVAKNKYFWIISLAGWLGFLEGAQGTILQWLYNYGKLCTSEQYSLITLIYGNASLWGMLAAPFLIKKWGKKRVLIATNLLNILFIALLYPSKESIWLVLVCMWMNALMNSFALILNPTIQADIRDYQQYRTGERIDGMFAAVGLIGSFISMATSSVLPAVYEKYGIYSGNGYENMYDILFDKDVLYTLIGALILLSVVGATMNVIPYFFYDLTEDKQKTIIKILEVRAMSEDLANGKINREEVLERVREIRLKALDDEKNLAEIRKNKNRREYKVAAENNAEILQARAVLSELNKFGTPEMQSKLAVAKEIAANGLAGVTKCEKSIIRDAKALPKNTAEEKAYRKEEIETARSRMRCKKATMKHYPNGLTEFDDSIFDKLYAEEYELDERQLALNKQLSNAKSDKKKLGEIRAEIKKTNNERYIINGKIKQATRENTMYNVCAKAYLDAVRLIKEEENYRIFAEA